jgi:lysophospholipase L1-like esterase
MSWIKKKTFSILIVVISSFFGVLCIEVGLRILNINNDWIVTEEANILRNFEFSYNISNLYSSDVKVADYVRNKFGLRDNCTSTDDIEILTIGGSTTDQRYVPFQSTYQYMLEKRLKEVDENFGCVSNAGVDGHSTWGHIFAFEKWFPLIPNLQPKLIILYVGINDANFTRVATPNYGFDTNNKKGLKTFLKNFEIVRALLPIYRFSWQKIIKPSEPHVGHAPKLYLENDYTITNMNEKTVVLSKKNALAFETKMIKILREVKRSNAIPICVTQPHRYINIKDDRMYGIPNVLGDKFSGIDFDFSIRQLNAVLIDLCGDMTIDLYNHNFSNHHFYDGVHTTSTGSQEIGEIISKFIISKFY